MSREHGELRSSRGHSFEERDYSQEYESLLDYDFVNSHKFNAGCHPENFSNWSVSLCKRFNPSFIGIFLHLLAIENESQVNCRRSRDQSFETNEYEGLFIRYSFCVMSQTGTILKKIENPKIVHMKIGDSWGEDNFIPFDIMKDPNSHLILDDTLRIKIDLWIFQDCHNEILNIYKPDTLFLYVTPQDQFSNLRFRKNKHKHTDQSSCDSGSCGEKAKDNLGSNDSTSPVLSALWESRELADVTLKCGTETFQVHKCLLCAASPVFRAMFTSQMDETLRNEIFISDMSPDVLVAFVHYIYKGHVPNTWKWDNTDALSELLNACEKYQILELKTICGKALVECMTIQNVGKTAVLVHLFFSDDPNLLELVYSFIVRNLPTLRETASFQVAVELHPAAFSKCLLSAAMKNICNF